MTICAQCVSNLETIGWFWQMHELAIARRLVADEEILTSAGYTVYEPESISEVPELFRETQRKQESAMLALGKNDFTNQTGKFLFLMKDGQAIAGCRAKFSDLLGETFECHQRRTIPQLYDLNEDMLVSVAPHLNSLIHGKHIYVGELEFEKKHRGRLGATTAFVRIMLASSLLKWPDATCAWCILPERHRRIAVDYGFNTTVRVAFNWREPVPGGRLPDWLIAVSSREQLIYDLTKGYWGSSIA